MFNKIYDKIKLFIKENIIAIGVLLSVYVVCNIEFPYYIDAPGTIIPVNDRVEIADSYESSGSFHMASVSEIKGIIPTLLWAMIDKDWDIVKKEDKVYNNETYEQASIRSHLLLDNSMNNAVLVAYDKAQRNYEITNQKFYIVYIDPEAKTDLQIGDEIISINENKITSLEEVRDIINNTDVNNSLKISVIRDEKEVDTQADIFLLEGEKYIGISVINNYDIITDPQITFSFLPSESGSSGGLMLSLTIYNSLVEEDITKGKKIIGTGTIDANGVVGAIGGIKYKLAAAVREGAEIFIVPTENYEEARKIVEGNDYNIKLIQTSTFDETLEKLKEI